MLFAGAGSTAASVASCPSAHQDDHITRLRNFPDHVVCGSSAYYSAYFHSLSHVVFVINFVNKTCSKTDLVAV